MVWVKCKIPGAAMPAASKLLQYFVYKKTKDTVLGMRIFMNEFSASSLNRQRSEDKW